MRFESLAGNFGKSVRDIEVSALTDENLVKLLDCLYTNRFVAIKTQGLNKADYLAFAHRIGDPILLSKDADFPEIAHISNLQTDSAESRLGVAHWHTDQSFKTTVSSVTMLYSVQAPGLGGETKFCDMVAAYEALPRKSRMMLRIWS